MPRYDYECKSCKQKFEGYSCVAERHNHKCPSCDSPADLVFSTDVFIYKQMMSYYDRGLGCYVEDREDRKKKIKEKGFVEVGDMKPHQLESYTKPKGKSFNIDEKEWQKWKAEQGYD
jgi:putative FmdB family regulatory protein